MRLAQKDFKDPKEPFVKIISSDEKKDIKTQSQLITNNNPGGTRFMSPFQNRHGSTLQDLEKWFPRGSKGRDTTLVRKVA